MSRSELGISRRLPSGCDSFLQRLGPPALLTPAIKPGLPIDQIGTNISSDTDEYGQSRLHIAAHEGRMDQVFQLINAGASVNVEDRNGYDQVVYIQPRLRSDTRS